MAITPALFAALTWKRATRQVGLASIVGSTLAVIFFELILPRIAPSIIESAQGAAGVQVFGGDPWGIPSIYPAAIISIGALILVSLMTPPPKPEELEKLFPK